MKQFKKIISFAVIVFGFTAMASQIVFMRELLIVFYGNELSIGLILGAWLIAGAVGSSILGSLSDKIKNRITLFSLCQIGLSLFIPTNILLLRSLRSTLNILPGEATSIFLMIVSSFIIVAPICLIIGFMFSLACRVYQNKTDSPESSIARVYMLEAVGAILGGLFTSFILIRMFSSITIAGILSSLNIIAAFILFIFSKENKFKAALYSALSVTCLVIFSFWISHAWEKLDKYSLEKQWYPEKLISSKNSIYGNIVLTKKADEFSFFDTGLHLYTVPDRQAAEEAVHFTLLEHPAPQDVLLIGGGVGGLIEEIIKHPVQRVDYLELDPLIIKTAKDYLPVEYYAPLENKKVSLKNIDARLFIKNTDRKYDCIIMNLGDPRTAQLNRYYTVEFFKEANKILKEGGIISFGVTSSENYINEELQNFLSSLYFSLQEVFPDIKVIPGDTAYFLASNKNGALSYDYKYLMKQARERNLDIKYVREYYLFSRLSPQRLLYIDNAVKRRNGAKINYDFRPVSYYYNTIFWSSYFRDSLFSKILKAATGPRVWKVAFFIYALIIFFAVTMIRCKNHLNKAVLTAVMATGFSEITFQVLILLSFQIIYGYLFYKLGFILTSFMIGLALGSYLIIKMMPKLKRPRQAFIWTQVSICIYPLILPLLFYWLVTAKNEAVLWAGSNILFALLPVAAGFIGGFQFPLANKICLQDNKDVGRIAGLSYGLDLLGSCLGALLAGVILVPVLGITQTCFLVAGLNCAILVILLLFR